MDEITPEQMEVRKKVLAIFKREVKKMSPFMKELCFGDDPTGTLVRQRLGCFDTKEESTGENP